MCIRDRLINNIQIAPNLAVPTNDIDIAAQNAQNESTQNKLSLQSIDKHDIVQPIQTVDPIAPNLHQQPVQIDQKQVDSEEKHIQVLQQQQDNIQNATNQSAVDETNQGQIKVNLEQDTTLQQKQQSTINENNSNTIKQSIVNSQQLENQDLKENITTFNMNNIQLSQNVQSSNSHEQITDNNVN
eukprot:TRINITY_DN14422_c0_g1_i5.p3 TRINITY_DN14422_c0_g1~~TRINITY_DN14422_c0_g1_i5.p3  ORF type:complete len:185 (+),score=37.39 TRINITY_DN14422_c0_g1_i5:162-716(+)